MKNQALDSNEESHFPFQGGCLCGRVRFALKRVGPAVICHCEQCRKAQGVAFACNFPISLDAFRLTRGEEALASYGSSATKSRIFCSNCGSPLWSMRDGSSEIRIRTGCLDDTSAITPSAHIFARSCPNWAHIDDSLPRYEKFEPGRD